MSTYEENACRGCKIEFRHAALSSDFGMSLFMRKAGDKAQAILDEFGTFTKGKNAGKSKGYLVWVKVLEGGYDYKFGLGVLRGGSSHYRVTATYGKDHKDCEYIL